MATEKPAKKGSKLLKILGIITVVGIVFAILRIVLRVFLEKKPVEEFHEGV